MSTILVCICRRMSAWKAKDPVDRLRDHLDVNESITEDEIAAIDQKVAIIIEDAVQFASESPQPSAEQFLSEIPQF